MLYVYKKVLTGIFGSLLVFTCTGCTTQVGRQKIYGGTLGAPEWVVRIKYYNPDTKDESFCSGSLINSVTVLTAKHCVNDRKSEHFSVLVQDKEFINVGAIVEDPNQDVALMQLIRPVNLAVYGQVDTNPAVPSQGEEGLLYGYGTENKNFNDTNRDVPARKKTATVTFISNVGEGKLIYQGKDGAGRHGDSGGPLMYNNKIVGVESNAIKTSTTDSLYTVLDAARLADAKELVGTQIEPNVPTINGLTPVGDNKSVLISVTPGVIDRAHPAPQGYAFFFKWATDGDSWRNAKLGETDSNHTLYPADLSSWDSDHFDTLWAITVLPKDVTGAIVHTNNDKKPLDGDQSNTTYLARVQYIAPGLAGPLFPKGWYGGEKENNSDFICPEGQVMVGRYHKGDTTQPTAYRCSFLWINNQLAVPDPDSTQLIYTKESSGDWLECPQNMFMIGRAHSGDADGKTSNYCARFHFGTDKKRVVKYNLSVDDAEWSPTFKESDHSFECGQEAGSYSPPPQNTAMIGRMHKGRYYSDTRYVCAKIPAQH